VAVSKGDGNTLTYQWKKDGDANVGNNLDNYTPTVSATTEFWVVVTDNNSCSVTSDKAKITVSGHVAGRVGNAVCSGGNSGGEIGVQ
jgi:hypothetical protein